MSGMEIVFFIVILLWVAVVGFLAVANYVMDDDYTEEVEFRRWLSAQTALHPDRVRPTSIGQMIFD